MQATTRDKILSYITWGLIALFSILYFSLCFSIDVWTDEIFTLNLIKGNLAEITTGTIQDVHPPLYYYFAKLIYSLCGDNLFFQKILVMLPMIITLCLAPLKIKKRFG